MSTKQATRNSEALDSFTFYCQAHPDERFWQALRNWVGWGYVMVTNNKDDARNCADTFYWETGK